MTTNSPVAAGSFALTRSSPRLCSSAREVNRHMVNRPPPIKNTNPFSGWYFFACRRVFTGVGAESCGLRICAAIAMARTFRSLRIMILSALPA